MPKPTLERIPEQRVAAILQRAAELDRGFGESMALDAIRTAAIEAGISSESVDRALAEFSADEMPEPPVVAVAEPRDPRNFLKRWLGMMSEPLKFGTLGLVLGFAGILGEAGPIIPIFSLMTAAFHLIRRDRPSARATRFVLAFSAMSVWSAVGMASAEIDGDLVASVLVMCGMILAAGTFAIKFIARRQPEAEQSA
jgi:hypothetical protein